MDPWHRAASSAFDLKSKPCRPSTSPMPSAQGGPLPWTIVAQTDVTLEVSDVQEGAFVKWTEYIPEGAHVTSSMMLERHFDRP